MILFLFIYQPHKTPQTPRTPQNPTKPTKPHKTYKTPQTPQNFIDNLYLIFEFEKNLFPKKKIFGFFKITIKNHLKSLENLASNYVPQ